MTDYSVQIYGIRFLASYKIFHGYLILVLVRIVGMEYERSGRKKVSTKENFLTQDKTVNKSDISFFATCQAMPGLILVR